MTHLIHAMPHFVLRTWIVAAAMLLLNGPLIGADDGRCDLLPVVRAYADLMLAKGRDRYGSADSPLFAEDLDRGTLDILSGDCLQRAAAITRDQWGQRPHDRMLGGANPQHCQNLYQVLYAPTEITGEPGYAGEADRSLR